MPAVRTIEFPLANYASGSRTSAARNVADDKTTFRFELDRCTSADLTIWPNQTTTIALSVEQSNDGVTWRQLCAFTGAGGVYVDNETGLESPISYIQCLLFQGTGRQLRCAVTIAGGPLRSSGSIVVS